ncbi:MAG: superoxide dismutase [Alphaproteobacteria bacterium]|nr:superoxide dismutase [Alphaproteobacteria bacterium]
MPLELPELPYAYDALDPYMSAETLEYHHDKHHNAYVTAGNKLFENLPHLGETLEDIIVNAYEDGHQALFNNAGQHWNHSQFWKCIKPAGGGAMPGNLEKAVKDNFGSAEAFRDAFITAGLGQFGSGWCWLIMDKEGKLAITKTPNGENPLIHNQITLLGCDIWEHSYYIDYRNARAKYMEAFIDNLVNWDYVAELYKKAAG